MDNKSIYKKTIGFSLWRVLWDFLACVAFFGMAAAGFIIADKATNYGLVGLGIGAILGAVAAWLILHFVGYTYKAGQIAMMTKGVVEGKLPENTIKEGRKIVKERFSTVTAYYFVTGAIKGIFNQIGTGITAIGQAVGGDTGGSIGSTISAVINTIIAYLCDCCLGWVFYKKDESATKATLEGAAIFFKHGKTLARNLGRVFGMGAIKLSEKVDLIVKLEHWDKNKVYDRIGTDAETTNILGLDITTNTIPIRPGRNIAVILEIAAMNNRQKRMGYNTAEEFNKRIMEQMMAPKEDDDD